MAVAGSAEHVGIVVGRIDQGETDRIVRLLTPDLGVLAMWARGARRGRSPWAVLDLAARVRVRVRATRGELVSLQGVEVEDPRLHLRGSFLRAAHAAYFCELAAALSGQDHAEPRLYGLLDMALLLLDATTTDPANAFRVGFEAKALTFAGINPVTERCIACTRPLGTRMVFAPSAGGVFHPDDAPGDAVGLVSTEASYLAAIEAARRRPLRDSLDVALPHGPDLYGEVVTAHLRRVLPSRAVLSALIEVG